MQGGTAHEQGAYALFGPEFVACKGCPVWECLRQHVQTVRWVLHEKTRTYESAPVWLVSLHLGAFCDRTLRKASWERPRDSPLKGGISGLSWLGGVGGS